MCWVRPVKTRVLGPAGMAVEAERLTCTPAKKTLALVTLLVMGLPSVSEVVAKTSVRSKRTARSAHSGNAVCRIAWAGSMCMGW